MWIQSGRPEFVSHDTNRMTLKPICGHTSVGGGGTYDPLVFACSRRECVEDVISVCFTLQDDTDDGHDNERREYHFIQDY
jgi:hypothetical protein